MVETFKDKIKFGDYYLNSKTDSTYPITYQK